MLPKQARYQLRYTLLFSFLFSWVYSLDSNALTPYRLVRSHIQSNDLCYNTPLKTAEKLLNKYKRTGFTAEPKQEPRSEGGAALCVTMRKYYFQPGF